MKKAIAVIPFVAQRRRRAQAQRGAKLGGPALLVVLGAGAAYVVRRRKRTDAGFDASPTELSDRQGSATTATPDDAPADATSVAGADADAPPNGQGRPSTFEGDPADTVPLAAARGVGEGSVAPDTGSADPLVAEAEAAAAAEAGAIGGPVPDTPPSNEPDFATDPVTRPSEEHSGNSFESFSEREG